MKKKRIIITISLYVVVLTALYLTVCVWASIFDENWVMGKTEEQIAQRYGRADKYHDDCIEYWEKQGLGYKVNRIYLNDEKTAISVEYDYTNGNTGIENESNNNYANMLADKDGLQFAVEPLIF